MWIKVITSQYAKPDAREFKECTESMGIEEWKVVMIWDNFLTDGWAVKAGIDFIKAQPIITEWGKQSISRSVQVFMRSIVDKIAVVRGNI